ncbi:hypothetical protein SUDANB120_00039 [Streptomyces sp. enrichment culture]
MVILTLVEAGDRIARPPIGMSRLRGGCRGPGLCGAPLLAGCRCLGDAPRRLRDGSAGQLGDRRRLLVMGALAVTVLSLALVSQWSIADPASSPRGSTRTPSRLKGGGKGVRGGGRGQGETVAAGPPRRGQTCRRGPAVSQSGDRWSGEPEPLIPAGLDGEPRRPERGGQRQPKRMPQPRQIHPATVAGTARTAPTGAQIPDLLRHPADHHPAGVLHHVHTLPTRGRLNEPRLRQHTAHCSGELLLIGMIHAAHPSGSRRHGTIKEPAERNTSGLPWPWTCPTAVQWRKAGLPPSPAAAW